MDSKKLEPKKLFSPFSVFALIVFLSVIISNFYFFYFKKSYKFIVESSCDASKEQCFQRDCTDPNNCPPNELAAFKRYSLEASDFQYCKNEDCTEACETKQIKCEKIECTENQDMGESCSNLIVGPEDLIQ